MVGYIPLFALLVIDKRIHSLIDMCDVCWPSPPIKGYLKIFHLTNSFQIRNCFICPFFILTCQILIHFEFVILFELLSAESEKFVTDTELTYDSTINTWNFFTLYCRTHFAGNMSDKMVSQIQHELRNPPPQTKKYMFDSAPYSGLRSNIQLLCFISRTEIRSRFSKVEI